MKELQERWEEASEVGQLKRACSHARLHVLSVDWQTARVKTVVSHVTCTECCMRLLSQSCTHHSPRQGLADEAGPFFQTEEHTTCRGRGRGGHRAAGHSSGYSGDKDSVTGRQRSLLKTLDSMGYSTNSRVSTLHHVSVTMVRMTVCTK